MTTAFEEYYGRKPDLKRDIGEPFGSYCEVTVPKTNNTMEGRTIGCLYLSPTMNGTGTHLFMKLDNKQVISANHYRVLPITPLVTATVNGQLLGLVSVAANRKSFQADVNCQISTTTKPGSESGSRMRP